MKISHLTDRIRLATLAAEVDAIRRAEGPPSAPRPVPRPARPLAQVLSRADFDRFVGCAAPVPAPAPPPPPRMPKPKPKPKPPPPLPNTTHNPTAAELLAMLRPAQ